MGLVHRPKPDDGIDVICAQHQAIRALVDSVGSVSPGARRGAVENLCGAIASHEAAEALLLRPVTRTCVLGGEVIADVRAAEEMHVRDTLDDLLSLEAGSPQFPAVFDEFAHLLREHMDSEERYELPLVRAYRDEDALVAMGTVLNRDEPVLLPDRSGVADAVISPIVTLVDKVRDVVTAGGRP